jgi:hypothetical protein
MITGEEILALSIDGGNLNIITLVLAVMEEAEEVINSGPGAGAIRKDYVIDMIRLLITAKWGVEYYNSYAVIIPFIIEFLIAVSQKNIVLAINKKVRKIFPCV